MKVIFYLILFFISLSTSADTGGSDTFEADQKSLVTSLLSASVSVSLVVGLYFGYKACIRFIEKQKYPNDPRYELTGALWYLLTMVALINPFIGFDWILQTLALADPNGICIAYNSISTDITSISDPNCFQTNTSSYSQNLLNTLKASSGSKFAELFNNNFRFLVGIFQVIAFVFYIIGWVKLTSILDGTERNSKIMPCVMIICSSLVMNLPFILKVILDGVEILIKWLNHG
ncbi:hypothetical protein [Photobacterium leiognathi]|uniref:hypothetical protein n=1 Tax=Photobacterium leiognathi TaxID=553611 RepID=UPI002980CE60|nr:hypothetical protein [Photobacterium leiognathi]